MEKKEKRLSSYIESLNKEKKPKEHGSETETEDIEELFETVRLIRSLKEPDMAKRSFSKSLAANVKTHVMGEKGIKKPRRKWFYGTASVAAAVICAILLNTIGLFGKADIVYAMEQAFKELLAYNVPNGYIVKNINTDQVVNEQPTGEPQVKVPVDLKAEAGDQKNADAGHSPWKLDPIFVAQVFVSLKISPEGIQGDYPIKYEDLKVIKNTGKEAIVGVSGNETPIRNVYLKRLIRQDNSGIWTVVGYDPVK